MCVKLDYTYSFTYLSSTVEASTDSSYYNHKHVLAADECYKHWKHECVEHKVSLLEYFVLCKQVSMAESKLWKDMQPVDSAKNLYILP